MSVADRRAERARRQPPAVVLRHLGEPGTVMRDLCAGLEEEGVPVLLETSEPATAESRPAQAGAVAMAFAAAQASTLGVGIGVDAAAVCVHHAKRPAASPVLTADLTQARWCGHNAARLVVGLPFKQRPGTTGERMEESWPHS
ncbi:glycerol dehydratase reactivase beta/small subunit family protein [Prauserella rugosa]|uniref:Dehydratase medium subunit n=1 Tax=Prauserella rugosa TaxID=43354 RepID=A0A660CHS3_9PSEU|nr:glycerol dehydratase reactivase beta/small subunit family protein [Prauserella rugosa]TWH21964.1 dehydratase medium subunit [Prauserella rugosa]